MDESALCNQHLLRVLVPSGTCPSHPHALTAAPLPQICSKGMGSAMLTKPKRMEHVVRAAASVSRRAAITFKTRTGYADKDQQRCAADILAGCGGWGAAAVTLHGRTRNQRYSRLADWGYVERAAEGMPEGVQLIGNGDVLSWEEYAEHMRGGKVRARLWLRYARFL